MILYPWKPASSHEWMHSREGLIGTDPVSMENTEIQQITRQDVPLAKLSLCDGMFSPLWRIQESIVGIPSPIVSLNKAIPGDADRWNSSMEDVLGIASPNVSQTVAKQTEFGSWHPSIEDPNPSSRTKSNITACANHSNSSTKPSIASGNPSNNRCKSSIAQIKNTTSEESGAACNIKQPDKKSCSSMGDDILGAFELQLHQYAQSLLDVLGEAVRQRVNNLSRNTSRKGHHQYSSTKPNIACKPGKAFVNPSETHDPGICTPNSCQTDVNEIRQHEGMESLESNKSTNECMSQGGLPGVIPKCGIPKSSEADQTSPNDPAHCAKSHCQDQLEESKSGPQTDRIGGERCQTGSDTCSYHGNMRCRVAILFSGGIDSMVLAALADR